MNNIETKKGWATALKKWNSGTNNAVEILQRLTFQALSYIQGGENNIGRFRLTKTKLKYHETLETMEINPPNGLFFF